jgi:hypothetical protein
MTASEGELIYWLPYGANNANTHGRIEQHDQDRQMAFIRRWSSKQVLLYMQPIINI